jgi:hypothetical protein
VASGTIFRVVGDFLNAAKSSMKRVTGKGFHQNDFIESRRNFKWDFSPSAKKS